MVSNEPAVMGLFAWLAVLAIGAAVARRELGLLQATFFIAGASMRDGIEIGAVAPQALRETRRQVTVFLGEACGPCVTVAEQLGPIASDVRARFVIRGEPSRARRLLPDHHRPRVIIGEEAERVAGIARVRAEPFAIASADGLVVGKAYVRGVDDIERLLELA